MIRAHRFAALLVWIAGVWLAPAIQVGAEVAGDDLAGARVASINLCTDQLLVRLLEPERIASISVLGADPHYSAVAERAAGLPVNHAQAEEILSQDPGLVLAGSYGNRATKEMLRRLGYRVEELAPPSDIEGVRAQLRDVGDLLGAAERAEAVVAELDDALRAAESGAEQERPTAVIYESGGVTLGSGGLPQAVLEAAGLTNLAAERGIQGAAPFPLELLVVSAPDILVLYDAPDEAPPSQSASVLKHPALHGLSERIEIAVVPRALWTCGGPEVVEAIERLVQARQAAVERKAAPVLEALRP